MSMPLAIDLFAGAGGLGLGLAQAGWSVRLALEIERDFAQSYRHNHPDTEVIESDIAGVDFSDLLEGETVDLVAGGPPCQGFSTVGKKEFTDPRNSLYGQFLRAVDTAGPRFVLFENVAGFTRMYEGVVHQAVLRSLQERGYTVQSRILDPVYFGLPQYRARTIIIGALDGLSILWPTETHGESTLLEHRRPFVTLDDALSDLPELGADDESETYASAPRNSYQASLRRGQASRLTEHNSANYGERMRTVLSMIPPGGSVLDLPEELRPRGYFSNTYARLWADRPAPTITRNFGTPSSSRCVHPTQNRALSTREGARLQSFPDDYRFFGSKTSKNLQIGNAVPPLFAQALGRVLLQSALSLVVPQPH